MIDYSKFKQLSKTKYENYFNIFILLNIKFMRNFVYLPFNVFKPIVKNKIEHLKQMRKFNMFINISIIVKIHIIKNYIMSTENLIIIL